MDLQQTIADHWSSRVLILPIGATTKASVAAVVRSDYFSFSLSLFSTITSLAPPSCTATLDAFAYAVVYERLSCWMKPQKILFISHTTTSFPTRPPPPHSFLTLPFLHGWLPASFTSLLTSSYGQTTEAKKTTSVKLSSTLVHFVYLNSERVKMHTGPIAVETRSRALRRSPPPPPPPSTARRHPQGAPCWVFADMRALMTSPQARPTTEWHDFQYHRRIAAVIGGTCNAHRSTNPITHARAP